MSAPLVKMTNSAFATVGKATQRAFTIVWQPRGWSLQATGSTGSGSGTPNFPPGFGSGPGGVQVF